ncbi:MAG: alpha/beta fold hydrolase, partial [Dehalococcoidia bacterium]
MKLFAREAGTAGETVILVHGFAGSHAIWREVAPILARTHRVLAYD